LRILLLDNKSQYSGELIARLEGLGLKLDVQGRPEAVDDREYDGTIISGGAIPYRNLSETLKRYRHFLHNTNKPLLAICLGLKIMAHCYGGKIRKLGKPEVGSTLIRFHKNYPLAPSHSEMWVYQDHIFELFDLPEFLENYGSSENCRIQAVKHHLKPQFGVQFHPERDNSNEGHLILENFAEFCLKGGY
jgi:GMP synthase (glutamine-hydrolysing)